MPTFVPYEHPTYEVKVVLSSRSHPEKWMRMIIEDALDQREELIHITVAEVEGA